MQVAEPGRTSTETRETDMVSQFAFGKSLNALSDPEFKSMPVRVFQQYLPSLHVIKAFPFVRLLNSLPLWIAKRISHAVEMGHELEQVSSAHLPRKRISQS
jgi:hypothetical protein